MIVRLIVVDPTPEEGRSDLLVYQLPEKSRELGLFTDLLEKAGYEWAVVQSSRAKRVKETKQ